MTVIAQDDHLSAGAWATCGRLILLTTYHVSINHGQYEV